MEYISNKLTDYVLKKGVIKEDSYDIYQYGVQCFLEITLNILCSIIIALSLGMLIECILFFVFFIPLRSYSGGIHMKTYFSCLFFSCIILISTLLAVKYVTVSISISFIVYILCAIAIKLVGPVNHPNRRVDNQENILFIRKTNMTLFANAIVAIIFILTDCSSYLFLEAIVYLFVFLTSLIGKINY